MTKLDWGYGEMTSVKKIIKGDIFWCLGQGLSQPVKGTVIALTSNLGKRIGLEFAEPVGAHSCDGRGKDGYCLWVREDDILTEDEYQAKLAADAATTAALDAVDLEELTL